MLSNHFPYPILLISYLNTYKTLHINKHGDRVGFAPSGFKTQAQLEKQDVSFLRWRFKRPSLKPFISKLESAFI